MQPATAPPADGPKAMRVTASALGAYPHVIRAAHRRGEIIVQARRGVLVWRKENVRHCIIVQHAVGVWSQQHKSAPAIGAAGVLVGIPLHGPPCLGVFGPGHVIVRLGQITGIVLGLNRQILVTVIFERVRSLAMVPKGQWIGRARRIFTALHPTAIAASLLLHRP